MRAERFGCVTLDGNVVWISPFNSHAALQMNAYEAYQLWKDLGSLPTHVSYMELERQQLGAEDEKTGQGENNG